MIQASPWAIAANKELAEAKLPLFSTTTTGYCFSVYLVSGSLWVAVDQKNTAMLWFRLALAPAGNLKLLELSETSNGATFKLSFPGGKLETKLCVLTGSLPVLRYTTTMLPDTVLSVPFWPRDILATEKNGNLSQNANPIYAAQEGGRSGFLYCSAPFKGTVLYLQNLTALSDYCQQTQASCTGTVGGNWPELGFALPVGTQPLKPGKSVVISDAFVAFDPETPKGEEQLASSYLELLARIYILMPKPATHYQDWPGILEKGLKDLLESPGCWSQLGGHKYFNAYVSDYLTPPELMVQLAVLLPLVDYAEWSGEELDVIAVVKEGLPSFYNEKLGSVVRWLPSAEDKLEGEEEQKKPNVMDSWYLHHPLLNLSRLALRGDKEAKKLFLDSLKYAMKVAKHFNYQWPVFYKMDTLEVVKAETAPGKGGEHDVPGTYAHILLQAYELTGKASYLKEAAKAAKMLEGRGFKIFYQANNTAFSAGALLKLFKLTGNKRYLELSYTCLANIFRNTKLWDCNYGFGKHFPSFFALYPLSDAPYTAVYEEQEVFCALHDYLAQAGGVDILPSVRLLVAEYIRYLVDRAVYYYPPMLPKEMLKEKPKIGEVDPKLWIALEDLQDGWEQSGTVGQEVYGAGNAFGILPRHFIKVPATNFMVYVDYPYTNVEAKKGSVTFKVIGDGRLECLLAIVKAGEGTLPAIVVKDQNKQDLKGTKASGRVEYRILGNEEISITWKTQK